MELWIAISACSLASAVGYVSGVSRNWVYVQWLKDCLECSQSIARRLAQDLETAEMEAVLKEIENLSE